MTTYPAQQQMLRKIVKASQKSNATTFLDYSSDGGGAIAFNVSGGERLDLRLDWHTLLELRSTDYLKRLSRDRWKITDAAFAAVRRNFKEPAESGSASVNNTIHVHGNVTGGTLAQGIDVTISGADAAAMLAALRSAAAGVRDANARAAVLEQADNIDDELKAPAPKPSKVMTFLRAIPPKALTYAPLANAVSAIAKTLGLSSG